MEIIYFLFCLALINVVTCGQRVSCYYCRYLQFPYECKYIKQCEEGEKCYIERLETSQNISGWVQGCTKLCDAPFEAPLNQMLVGRSLRSSEITSPSPFNVIGRSTCRQCCRDDFCNIAGCGAPELEPNSTRLHCYNCKEQGYGDTCETVTLCDSDQYCSYKRERTIFRHGHSYDVYSSSCRSKQDCDFSSLAKNVSECPATCCDRSYCNTRCNLTLNLQTETEQFCATLNNYTYFTSTDSCVKISTTPRNFTEASLACAQDMADLVILQTQKVYQLIKELLKEWDVWIGGEKSPGEGFFQWKNGGIVDVHSPNWLRAPPLHQPDNIFTLNERCVYMNYQDVYKWYDTDCNRTMGYICEIKATTMQTCLSHGGFKLSGVCIRIEKSQKLTWDESSSICKRFSSGSLITINSVTVTDSVFLLLFSQLQNDTNYWIGGRTLDQHSAEFAWTDGTQFSQMQKFPPLWGGPDVNEHYCMVLDHAHAFNWSYRHCGERYHYVCEVSKETLLRHQTTSTQPPSTSTASRHTITSTQKSPNTYTQTKQTTTSIHQPPHTSTQTIQTLTSSHQPPHTSTQTIQTLPSTHQSPHTSTQTIQTLTSTHQQPHTSTQTIQTLTSTHQPPHTSTQTIQTLTSTHQPPHTSTQTIQTLPSTHQSPHTSTQTIQTLPSTHQSPHTSTQTIQTLTSTHQSPHTSTQTIQTLTSTHQPPHTSTQTIQTLPSTHQSPNTSTQTKQTLTSTHQSPHTFTQTIQTLTSTHQPLETITHPQTSKSASSISSVTPALVSSTAKLPYTIPPVSKTCHVCSGPEVLCEVLHEPTSCAPPDNYCMNTVYNHADGTRMVKRQCANFDTCYREWWMGSSDDDKCRTFDQDFYMTLDFQCSFCCVEDNCNVRLNPPTNTLYKDL